MFRKALNIVSLYIATKKYLLIVKNIGFKASCDNCSNILVLNLERFLKMSLIWSVYFHLQI